MKKLFKCGAILLAVTILSFSGYWLYLRKCDWNPQEAVEFATENAKPKSVGLCALYVRKSLNAGGIPLIRCGYHLRPIHGRMVTESAVLRYENCNPIQLYCEWETREDISLYISTDWERQNRN